MFLQANPEVVIENTEETPREFIGKVFEDSNANGAFDTNSLAEIGKTLINSMFVIGMFVAISALIVIAIRIMFARATGDVSAAKTSSNGIGWVLGSVVLMFVAPTIVMAIVGAIRP